MLSSIEICAGAGGQALGLERAGFDHALVAEIDAAAASTLRANRPSWDVRTLDVRGLSGRDFRGVDLFAGGVPCPPFSIAGKQLGSDDERDLFPTALRLVEESRPRAVLLENVPGLASARFADYRRNLCVRLSSMGYEVHMQVLNASHFGVPQLRPRFVLVALRPVASRRFRWPSPTGAAVFVGPTIGDLMASNGWRGATRWVQRAAGIAPTLVGGSKKHGGPDLGPTRSRLAWLGLGVDGRGVADAAPASEFAIDGNPRLTVRMGARIQGFPDIWRFVGKKTASWRQVGNAFPPPVAQAVGVQIMNAVLGLADVLEPEQTALELTLVAV